MLTGGIDVGAKTIKIVVAEDGKLLDQVIVPAGEDVESAIALAWDKLGAKAEDMEVIVATGSGRNSTKQAKGFATEVAAAAKGAVTVYPDARTVIDVGAEEGRAVKADAAGKVVDFAINEKCAAGAGIYCETMARALEVSLEELGQISLTSKGKVAMNAQCAVFAESELVALLHSRTPKPDMARAIHDAISDRIVSMVRQVGVTDKVVLIGGVARNIGFLESLKRGLETEVIIPDVPEIVAAFGAALLGAEGCYSKTADASAT